MSSSPMGHIPRHDHEGPGRRGGPGLLELRRTELREAMLAELRKLDGSVKSSVSLLTGLSPEDIDRLGGIDEG